MRERIVCRHAISSAAVHGLRSPCGATLQPGPRRAPCSSSPRYGNGRVYAAPRRTFADDFQIGMIPKVRAGEHDLGGDLFAYRGEESLEGLDGSLLPDPKRARHAEVDLIDQREVLVPFGVLDFIDSDGIDLTERAMLQSERDDPCLSGRRRRAAWCTRGRRRIPREG